MNQYTIKSSHILNISQITTHTHTQAYCIDGVRKKKLISNRDEYRTNFYGVTWMRKNKWNFYYWVYLANNTLGNNSYFCCCHCFMHNVRSFGALNAYALLINWWYRMKWPISVVSSDKLAIWKSKIWFWCRLVSYSPKKYTTFHIHRAYEKCTGKHIFSPHIRCFK